MSAQPTPDAAPSDAPAAPRYTLEADGAYCIDGYDRAPAFSSFLPAVAGLHGVPLWCLYVNRAQAIASFGVHHKNQAILEFLPANWAYQLVGVQGFRTFCRVDGRYYEPFRDDAAPAPAPQRTLRIRSDHVELLETHAPVGLSFRVEYFSPVNRPLGTLARRITLTNVSDRPVALELLDGLPVIIPAGFTDHGLKHLRHIMEAYASVRRVAGVPYYAAKVVAHDEAEVTHVTHGNFYAAWVAQDDAAQSVEPLVDPHVVFGAGHDLVTPRRFIAGGLPDGATQVWENRLPCALVPARAELQPGESLHVVALVGFAPTEDALTSALPSFAFPGGFDTARAESRTLLAELTNPALLASSVPALDAYARQNYLDNVLRGGVPHLLPSRSGPTPVHVYSRRHGDLERDYNFFELPAHPLSCGAGHYRDICQNRRHDVWFHPEIADLELRTFLTLLQADGYNPLSIEGYRWHVPPDTDLDPLLPPAAWEAAAALRQILARPFHPGELVHWAALHGLARDDADAWLQRLLAECDTTLVAGGHDGGYWIDHWTYLVDLLESLAGVFPERVTDGLTHGENIGWFDDGAYVVPRTQKYVRRGSKFLQLNAVADVPRAARPLPPVTPFGKLCALVAVKAVSFDAECRGIEMEAGRPGWNDSLNGLPGVFGSSSCEAAELARLAAWLRRHLPAPPETRFPADVADFLDAVVGDLQAPAYDWNRAANLREAYRARLRSEPRDETRAVAGPRLAALLASAEHRARTAVERSVDPRTGLVHTYFAATPTTADEPPHVSRRRGQPDAESPIPALTRTPLPLFLEGQVHWLRLQESAAVARGIHEKVRASTLFDRKLAMYELNECLDACPPEIGRARTFTRGWFENESIWLHMSYKYLLELLRNGLYHEFFADARTMLVPFMDPTVYGRSNLENSSFIASSANPDASVHGRGFIARLSGSTAEFIHIALRLTVGPRPMRIEPAGTLTFRLEPVLPGEWFTTATRQIAWRGERVEIPADALACALFGKILLVYHNPLRRSTYGQDAVRPVRYEFDGGSTVESEVVAEPLAGRVRDRAFRRIDVQLG